MTAADNTTERCTELLASFAATRDRALFDELAGLAEPLLRRRAEIEIMRRGLTLEVSEVVQETLLNIFRYAHTFRPQVTHAFATWSSRIVTNVVLRFLRNARRRKIIALSLDELEGVELRSRTNAEPLRRISDQEDERELANDFGLYLQLYFGSYLGLTDLQKRVLHRVEVLGQGYREIGDDLGMRVEAVKMVVYRARKRIHEDMSRAAAG